jgi:hypothetical protein
LFSRFNKKKNKGKEIKCDYSKLDLSRKYVFEPNWNRIKIEWVAIVIGGIIAFVYTFSDATFNSIKTRFMFGIWMIGGLSLVWSIIFLLFNKRKIEINENNILTYSFLSKKPDEINWDELDKAEYVLQNDKIRIQEMKEYEVLSSIGLMHYRTEDRITIQDLFDANLTKRNKRLEIKYW